MDTPPQSSPKDTTPNGTDVPTVSNTNTTHPSAFVELHTHTCSSPPLHPAVLSPSPSSSSSSSSSTRTEPILHPVPTSLVPTTISSKDQHTPSSTPTTSPNEIIDLEATVIQPNVMDMKLITSSKAPSVLEIKQMVGKEGSTSPSTLDDIPKVSAVTSTKTPLAKSLQPLPSPVPSTSNGTETQRKKKKNRVRRMSIGAALMMPPEPRVNAKMDWKTLMKFTMSALGILYGDIATSPMFVLKSVFRTGFLSSTTPELEVLCCLSYVIWLTLLLGVVKYCFVVLKADNYGEGGLLALFCSIPQPEDEEAEKPKIPSKYYDWMYLLSLLGCAFLLGDGIIVPAISMLAALEGFHSIERTHHDAFLIPVKDWIVPVACVLLVGLFYVQRYGLGKITLIFPPLLLLWCFSLSAIGISHLITLPTPLYAFSPYYMLRSLQEFGFSYTISKLSIILLVICGMEFFYADLGTFKRNPMTLSYVLIVAPSTLLSYLGQAAFLLQQPLANEHALDHIIHDLFFEASPSFLRWPLVILGMMVSLVGSQAVLSGSFALLDQAITLRALPPFLSQHLLAGTNHGTYYVPFFNLIYFLGSLTLILVFQDSILLSDLFGLCISGAMLITSFFTMIIMHVRWNTNWYWKVGFSVIVCLDLILFISALTKLASNAYLNLLFSISIFGIMYTYKYTYEEIEVGLEDSLWTMAVTRQHLRQNPRAEGLGIFISNSDEEVPSVLSLVASKLSVLPKDIVVLSVNCMRAIPFVAQEDRLNFRCVDPQQGLYRILLTHGFAERPMSISLALFLAQKRGLKLHPNLTYFVSRQIVTVHFKASWYHKLRIFLFEIFDRNVQQRDKELGLPSHQVMWISNIFELKPN